MPVRLVRLWLDHFSSRPDYFIHYLCSIVYADSAMASASHPSSGPTIETPHQPRSFSFTKQPFGCCESASSLLKYRRNIFSCALHGQISTSHLCKYAERLRASPSAVHYNGALQWRAFYGMIDYLISIYNQGCIEPPNRYCNGWAPPPVCT